MKSYLKNKILSIPFLKIYYDKFHEINFDKNYVERKNKYEKLSIDLKNIDRYKLHKKRFELKIRNRGYSVNKKNIGDVNIYCYIPSNWSHQDQIYYSAKKMGNAKRFDYKKYGYNLNCFIKDNNIRTVVGKILISDFTKLHTTFKFDFVLCYGLPWDICPYAINYIKENFGLPIINISFDDKNWWDEIHRGDKKSGLKNFSSLYDLNWVSSKISVDWHWHEGGQALYLPEGVNSEIFCPKEINNNYKFDVVFIGSRFGYREKIFNQLKKIGIKLLIAGPGWENGPVSEDKMIQLFYNSRIILGSGEMGYSRWLTNLKGRDFEAPSVGGGIYLTTFNSDLAECFNIGSEILCYRGYEEMIELIGTTLKNDDFREMSKLSRLRCLKDHQWLNRLEEILKFINVT